MPLDIRLLRNEPEKVKESQRRRCKDVNIVDNALQIDLEWRTTLKSLDNANKEAKLITNQMRQLRKDKNEQPCTTFAYRLTAVVVALCIAVSILYIWTGLYYKLMFGSTLLALWIGNLLWTHCCDKLEILKRRKLDTQNHQTALRVREKHLKQNRDVLLNTIGNIVDDTVPTIEDEEVERKVNASELAAKQNIAKPPNQKYKRHDELLWMIGGYERKQGAKVAGNKGYYLTGPATLLNMALQNYGVRFLTEKNFVPVYPPFFMNKDMMAKTAQLEDYDETLYHVTGETGDKRKYLIATSEQPLSALHHEERLKPKDLPLKYAGISTCFRKEAGGGKKFCGIFRVHQFDKIEQFVYCAPDESWTMLDELVRNAEQFYRSLGVEYRVINIVAKELNNAAAKKYDLEGWFPATQNYQELVSASNCTDYQAIAMETRYGEGGKHKDYVHMLNATLVATTRTICAILENYQTNEGIVIPHVLRPYLDFKYENGIIPFVNPSFTE